MDIHRGDQKLEGSYLKNFSFHFLLFPPHIWCHRESRQREEGSASFHLKFPLFSVPVFRKQKGKKTSSSRKRLWREKFSIIKTKGRMMRVKRQAAIFAYPLVKIFFFSSCLSLSLSVCESSVWATKRLFFRNLISFSLLMFHTLWQAVYKH